MSAPTATARDAKPRKKASKRKAAEDQPSAYDRLGRLASFGLEHTWQIPLLVPQSYDDFTSPAADAWDLEQQSQDGKGSLRLLPVGPIRHHYGRVARTTVPMRDEGGGVAVAVAFGDTKEWAERIQSAQGGALFVAQATRYRGELGLTLLELVDPRWDGAVRPRYLGKPRYMPPGKVLEKVHEALPVQLPHAASALRAQVERHASERELLEAAGLPGWTLEQVLTEVHMPASPAMAGRALLALHRIAAFVGLTHAHQHILDRPMVRGLTLATRHSRLAQLPFTATPEQAGVVDEIAGDMAQPQAMKRLLQADVGFGKSVPLLVTAAATRDAGGRVAILAPNTPLAIQLHSEFCAWFPDLDARLVTGELAERDLQAEQVLIGTTALLFRDVGELSLVVVDEEQKFSVDQREALTGLGAHMLSATATCIPRTMALARYGAVSISRLVTPHVQKNVVTRRWGVDKRRVLFEELTDHVNAGGQLLVIYPMKEARNQEDVLSAVETSYQGWDRLFPGMVRWLHSAADDATKEQILTDMRKGKAKILVATTVVEVGITIPDLRRVVIVSPERMGLAQIHQLRGRVARTGGDGWCDLYSPATLSDEQQSKLDAFLKCKDGFEVAELDMSLRGFGDLSLNGKQQSGADRGILFGSAITAEHVEPMEGLWERVNRRVGRKGPPP